MTTYSIPVSEFKSKLAHLRLESVTAVRFVRYTRRATCDVVINHRCYVDTRLIEQFLRLDSHVLDAELDGDTIHFRLGVDQRRVKAEALTARILGKAPEPRPVSLFDLARTCVEARQQWPSGHKETIWRGNSHSAYVSEGGRDGGGQLFLGLRNGKPGQQVEVIAGHLNPLEGWQFTLTREKYDQWVKKARAL